MYNNTLSWEYWSYNSAMASLCYRKDQLHADSSCFMMYVCLQTVLIRHRVCICVCDQCSWRPDCWEPVEQMQERKKEIVACLTFGFYSSGQKHKRLYSPPTRHSFFFCFFFSSSFHLPAGSSLEWISQTHLKNNEEAALVCVCGL